MMVPRLERISKTATSASILLILFLLLTVHPDLTWMLRAAGVFALFAGVYLGQSRNHAVAALCVLAAPVAPAVLRLLAGREGEVLDLVWMAGLAGALLRSTSWSRWTLPPVWRPLLGGWALALAFAWPVFVVRELGFDPAVL